MSNTITKAQALVGHQLCQRMSLNRPMPPSDREPNLRVDPPTFTIRLARPADAEKISSVLHAAFGSFAALYTEAAFEATALSSERVVQRMVEGPVWIAESAAGIVGTVAALSSRDKLLVRGMAVVPAARGQRIGSALLQEAERFAIARGHAVLELRTTLFLTAACRLYERHDFQRRPATEQLHGTPLIVMQKTLAAPSPHSGP